MILTASIFNFIFRSVPATATEYKPQPTRTFSVESTTPSITCKIGEKLYRCFEIESKIASPMTNGSDKEPSLVSKLPTSEGRSGVVAKLSTEEDGTAVVSMLPTTEERCSPVPKQPNAEERSAMMSKLLPSKKDGTGLSSKLSTWDGYDIMVSTLSTLLPTQEPFTATSVGSTQPRLTTISSPRLVNRQNCYQALACFFVLVTE